MNSSENGHRSMHQFFNCSDSKKLKFYLVSIYTDFALSKTLGGSFLAFYIIYLNIDIINLFFMM